MYMRPSAMTAHRPVAQGGEPVDVGDYVCSDRALYRIEQIAEGRIILEDCRDYAMLDIGPEQIEELRRVATDAGAEAADEEPEDA